MIGRIPRGGVLVLFAAGVLAGGALRARAETLVEFSSEARFQLDLHVPDAVIKALLPPVWAPNVTAQGAAKDAIRGRYSLRNRTARRSHPHRR